MPLFSRVFLKNFFVSRNSATFLWVTTMILIIITSVAAYYKVRTSPTSVALHYNVIVGVDVLGNKTRLYLIPFTALAIAVINGIVVRFLPLRRGLLEIMLAAVSCFCALVLLFALLLLFTVN